MIPMWKLSGRLGNTMFQYAYLYNQAKLGKISDIYVQDEVFFQESSEEIKQLFGQDIPPKTDMVAIHVRRGDYVNNPFYVELIQTDYYDRGMDLFPDSRFLIFSDDIEFCKKWFVGKQYEFFHETEIEDMNLMASCVGHIIANSSFSWWGAYISPYTQKVVAPSKDNWYSDGVERTFCPKHWIRI